MLFANIYNAMSAFLNFWTDPSSFGNILNSLYSNGSDSANATSGDLTVMWNPTQIGNGTYQNLTFWPQFAGAPEGTVFVFIFEVLGKIFEAYSIEPPSEYKTSVSTIAETNAAPTNDEIEHLLDILVERFLTTAICFLASCVIHIVRLSNGRALTYSVVVSLC